MVRRPLRRLIRLRLRGGYGKHTHTHTHRVAGAGIPSSEPFLVPSTSEKIRGLARCTLMERAENAFYKIDGDSIAGYHLLGLQRMTTYQSPSPYLI